MKTDQLIDIDTAAAILTLKPSTVRAMVRDRKLPVIRPAGARRVRFLRSAIERLAGLGPDATTAVEVPVPAAAVDVKDTGTADSVQNARNELRNVEVALSNARGMLEPAERGYFGSEQYVARARKALFHARNSLWRARGLIEAAATVRSGGETT